MKKVYDKLRALDKKVAVYECEENIETHGILRLVGQYREECFKLATDIQQCYGEERVRHVIQGYVRNGDPAYRAERMRMLERLLSDLEMESFDHDLD